MALDKVQLFSPTPFIPHGAPANKIVAPLEVLTGTYFCNNFTLNSGTNCYIRDTVYIMARGDVIINGGMRGDGDEAGVLPPMSYSILGSQWTSTGVNRLDQFGNYGNYNGAGIAGGRTAIGGLASEAIVNLRGSDGASGYLSNLATTTATVTGHYSSGGLAGKTLIIRALGNIIIDSSAFINCNGQWAQNWGASLFPLPPELLISGAGGGSGGVIILDADGDCINSGSLAATGGKGSNGLNGCFGGGGGGGGIIIVQSRYGTSSVGTAIVSAGIAGESSGTSLGSGGGGGCGGFGGNGGVGYVPGDLNPRAPLNGAVGVVRQWGTPW